MKTSPARCPRDHTCPNVRSHDTYSAHRYGCRSPAAIADRHRYDKLHEAGLHPHHLIPAGPYARRLQALAARDWRIEDIAAHTTLNRSQVAKIITATHRGTITQSSARRVDLVFRKLWWRDGPSPRAGLRARNRGWVVAAAFDDIDNMDEQPKTGQKDPDAAATQRSETADRRATIARHWAAGHTLQQTAWDLGLTTRTVARHRQAIAAEQAQGEAA